MNVDDGLEDIVYVNHPWSRRSQATLRVPIAFALRSSGTWF